MTDAVASGRSSGEDAGSTGLEAWEVFRQEREGDAMRHGGSVLAPDAELAVHYARELYGRSSGEDAGSTGLEAWEVFRQEREGDAMRHGGSVLAPDAELAVHYARELYGRRQESVRLWVVRRADIHVLDDVDLLDPPLDRSYKKPGGYVMREKLASARAKAGTAKPPARDR